MSTIVRGFINREMIASYDGGSTTCCLESSGYRVERGLSQEKLAVDAQIDRTFVSSLERGLENPTVSVLDKLASALSIPISESFGCPPKPLVGGRQPKSKWLILSDSVMPLGGARYSHP
jgi:DNA-binding XRE family transcriptional regulator